MRTIKTFEGFKKKDIESLIQPIKDSFLDLEDIGLIVKARVQDNRIHIHIDRSTYDYYKGYDVIETLLFAIPYLESEYNLKLGKCEIFTDDNYNITFIILIFFNKFNSSNFCHWNKIIISMSS